MTVHTIDFSKENVSFEIFLSAEDFKTTLSIKEHSYILQLVLTVEQIAQLKKEVFPKKA